MLPTPDGSPVVGFLIPLYRLLAMLSRQLAQSIRELKKPTTGLPSGVGSDLMNSRRHTGQTLQDLAFMGFVEVLSNLRTIFKILTLQAGHTAYQPDALILVDYPGFNLRIAKWATARD